MGSPDLQLVHGGGSDKSALVRLGVQSGEVVRDGVCCHMEELTVGGWKG